MTLAVECQQQQRHGIKRRLDGAALRLFDLAARLSDQVIRNLQRALHAFGH